VGLRYHDLRMPDHRRKACDDVAFAGWDQPQFSDSMNPWGSCPLLVLPHPARGLAASFDTFRKRLLSSKTRHVGL
jgi:hypothetical protein